MKDLEDMLQIKDKLMEKDYALIGHVPLSIRFEYQVFAKRMLHDEALTYSDIGTGGVYMYVGRGNRKDILRIGGYGDVQRIVVTSVHLED